MDYDNDFTSADFDEEDYDDDELEFKVVGVTFNNDDGTSRQEILRKIKGKEPPFNGSVRYTLRVYTYEGKPAVAVEANGVTIGNVPKDKSAYVAEQIRNIQSVSVEVYGGGTKKNGEKKNFGASASLIIDMESNTARYNAPQYNAPQYNAPQYNVPQYNVPQNNTYTYNSQTYSVTNTLTRNDRYLRAVLWCVCSCGALFPVSIYQLYKSMHLPKKDSVTHQLSYEWSKMDCYIAAALWLVLSFGFGFPVSIYYIYKSLQIKEDLNLDEIKNRVLSFWESVKKKFV